MNPCRNCGGKNPCCCACLGSGMEHFPDHPVIAVYAAGQAAQWAIWRAMAASRYSENNQ